MTRGARSHGDGLTGTTLGPVASAPAMEQLAIPALTILWHPDFRRVGERSLLNDPEGGPEVRLSRLSPLFGVIGSDRGEPLADGHLSRTPHRLVLEPHGPVRIVVDAESAAIRIDGEPLHGGRDFDHAALAAGAVVELGERVVLLLHSVFPFDPANAYAAPDDVLVGQSLALARVRQQIAKVADFDVPVLVRGESGTGKELVASAIHAASKRARGAFVAVNMAAIAPSTAAAALFGHERGAFTGASAASEGYFGRADGGTLFLDEIGDTPADVQPALLRALESGEVQPLGRDAAMKRDVRVIAATDADLDIAVSEGRFRLPLLERLSGYELTVPPLRERREDVGSLLVRFLEQLLAAVRRADRLAQPSRGKRPWLPATLVARAALYDWPGNVRELKNAARRLVIQWGDRDEVPLEPACAELFRVRASGAPHASDDGDPTLRERRLLRDIPEQVVIAALERHDYSPGAAAAELGVARSSIYALMESSPRIRKAAELTHAEVTRALEASSGDVRAAARSLEVSQRALVLRMKALGLGRG